MKHLSTNPRHFELSQRFYFEAAHSLARTIDAQGSRRIHGHTYEAEVTLQGQPDPLTGMLIDLAYLRQEIERVRHLLDHHFLDDIADLGPVTLENLCVFIANKLSATLPQLSCVAVGRRASADMCVLRL